MAEKPRNNITTAFAAAQVAHAVDLLRYSETVRELVEHHLQDLAGELEEGLRTAGLTERAVARTERYLAAARRTIASAYRQAGDTLEAEVAPLAVVEYTGHARRLNRVLGAELFSTSLNPNELEELATDSIVQGATQREWWATQSQRTAQAYATQVRLGVLQGETTDQIVRRVTGADTGRRRVLTVGGESRVVVERGPGVLSVARRDAEALVRTSVATVSNNTLERIYSENRDVLRGRQAVATLDLRTSPTCRARDGGAWDFDGNPLPESPVQVQFPGPPPWHFKCRTVLVPLTKSWDELLGLRTKRQQVEEVASSTRASMDGQVAGKLTYSDWLGNQSEARQRDVLGPARYQLWKDGRIDLPGMIDTSGRLLSLEDLKERV